MTFIRLKNLNIETKEYEKTKTAAMKFMRRTAGYSLLDHRRNEHILEELKVESEIN